ncbi:MAG: thiamine phosphate synthase [Candidatus Rokubacteria bacterium]|nr:thiamine phosphate synthase [Candidatus Rokubacteria bacterium]
MNPPSPSSSPPGGEGRVRGRLEIDLCVILDRTASHGRDLREILDGVIAGGGRLVQFREKEWPSGRCLPLLEDLRRRAKSAGISFVVNDRLDLALAVEADGFHVGQDDLPAPLARRLLPASMFLGVSTHSREQARQAQADGADYVAVGSVFPTATKPEFELVGLDLLRAVRGEVKAPLIAIGGITADNAPDVIRAGADGVAVISAICGAPDPAQVTRRMLERIRAAKAR